MLDRVRPRPPQEYCLLSVEKALALLDKLYDTFFAAPRKPNIRHFTKHFIKIEFLDKPCRPLFKEFDVWPEISLEPNPETKEKKESTISQGVTVNNNYQNTTGQNPDMTRKNRPRIKEKEDKEPAGGYCEACGAMFSDLGAHARSPRHAAFARDTNNFRALDNLIGASFLSAPVNGERRSLRNMCNGELDTRRSQPSPTVNGTSPRNGIDEEPRRTRCKKPDGQEDRQYYKVVGVSTKLRSSGGFVTKRKDSSPTCNGAKPLVVKFRKVRRSELSVLSDEAEQFMFPKRASSTSSTSGDDDNEGDDDDDDEKESRPKTPQPSPVLERRRQARPTALKEESSEEDSWLDDKRSRKRRVAPVVRRTRRAPCKPPTPEPEPPPETETQEEIETVVDPGPEVPVSPLREEPVEKCMKWEDGKLKYTPAVEQLEFAFESVPRSEPWFETFQRQDHDQVVVRNVPRCFALYSNSPKLPYEMGQLPPLKPDCCPLSNLPKPAVREPRSERYGTRGLKSRKLHKRVVAVAAQDSRPRKSPREHASTLAMLGSAGILRRGDDTKSTASEDTVSDALSAKPEPSEAQEADERLQKFLSEVFDDAAEFELDYVEGGGLPAAAAAPDVLGLVSECDDCDFIRNEIAANAERRRARRRGRFKKKNRTGWPNKKKSKKGSRTNSSEKTESSSDRSSEGSGDTANETCDEDNSSEIEEPIAPKVKSEDEAMDVDDSDDKPLRLDVKLLLEEKKKEKAADKDSARSSVSEEGEERGRKKKRALTNLASWLQPVVRVARVDAAARRLRSAAKPRGPRGPGGPGGPRGPREPRAARLR